MTSDLGIDLTIYWPSPPRLGDNGDLDAAKELGLCEMSYGPLR
jgi:hypothetical protein